jgi:hypothetical protein
MPHITADRVKDTTTTTGTGNITVSGSAPTGFRTLSAVMTVDGDTAFIAIVGGSEWEVCLATRVSANVYSRATPLASSTGSAVSFAAGTKDVFITAPAARLDPLFLSATSPATPAANSVLLYLSDRAHEEIPAVIDPNAVKRRLGFDFLDGRYAYSTANMQFGDAVTLFGIPVQNVTGTQSGSGHPDGANYYKRRSRYRSATAASAGSAAGIRFGNGTGLINRATGGRMRITWGISDAAAVANAAVFAGFMKTSANLISANADPSAQVNLIGIGADAGETTLSLINNDVSGTATKTALGTGSLGGTAPCNTSETDVYTVAIECNPGGSGWRWYVERENTGDIWSGTVTTDIPTSTTDLEPIVWRCNRATALAARVDFFLMDAVQGWRG